MTRNSFERDSNYSKEFNFTRLKFGIDKPILETELNEMQKIQEEKTNSIVRKIVPTGFLELVRSDFNCDKILYNPIVNNKQQFNSIAIPPARLIMSGYEVNLEGNIEINDLKGYTLINLGGTPKKGDNQCSFVFLELWFEEVGILSNIYKNGFVDGEVLENKILDERVGDETSRRVTLRYRIRVEDRVDFNRWPNGFGYEVIEREDSIEEIVSEIYAQGPLKEPNKDYVYLPATHNNFKNTDFYNDNGLYVANKKENETNKLEDYIFAVPLFMVKRRNNKEYSLSNPHGGVPYENESSKSDRPDGLFNNLIDPKDIIDLRKTISFKELNTTKLLDKNLKKLLTGELNTNSNDKLMRAQFGLQPIYNVDENYDKNAILHLEFKKQNLGATKGRYIEVDSRGETKYHQSALGYGLVLDGKISILYELDSTNEEFNTNGAIDFLIKPYWDGADEGINQTIFTILDERRLPIILFKKENGNFILERVQLNDAGAIKGRTIVDLKEYQVYNNEIYHIRITWDNDRNHIYINGNKVRSYDEDYVIPRLSPKYLKLGEIEDIKSYSPYFTGCLIDELIVYKEKLINNKFSQLKEDISLGEAKIYNSFNGVTTGFQDNENEQLIIKKIILDNASNHVNVKSPYGTKAIVNNASIYNKNGQQYDGKWEQVNSEELKFTLNTGNFKSKEELIVKYKIIIPGGFGIKDVPNKILKATLQDKDISFANEHIGIREIPNVINPIDSSVEVKKFYDLASTSRNENMAFVRVAECEIRGNMTNNYIIPPNLLEGYEILGIYYVNRPIRNISKNKDGYFELILENYVRPTESFEIKFALGGYTFDYEPHTKALVKNISKAGTVKIQADGISREYVVSTFDLLSQESDNLNGGIITSFLETKFTNIDGEDKVFGKSVFVTGNTFKNKEGDIIKLSKIEGIGTPFVKIEFENTPKKDDYIEIPVMITYQPTSSEILSIWYEYTPYQGILTDNKEKKLKRISDWKVFATTFGSGFNFSKEGIKNLKEKSIFNASNRLPGGQNFSYLLKGDNIDFEFEQITVNNESFSPNKRLIFRTQFLELIENNEYDVFSNSLTTELNLKKRYGKNYQDAFIESSIKNINFAIQNTTKSINKYLGAACLVLDEEGNILLFVMGEVTKNPTTESLIKSTHGDLFKLENNPIVVLKNDYM